MADDFKQTLWKAADKLRAQMDAAEYKHIVLGLIFLKYISDTFVKQQDKVRNMVSDPSSDYFVSEDPTEFEQELEERDYYIQDNVFWVPQDARWETLRSKAKQPDIGALVDGAMTTIENENSTLRGKLDKRFGRAQLGQGVLGELIDLISTIGFANKYDSSDLLGEVYEYFLGQFASAEGKKGGQFYTPSHVVKTLVAVLSPNSGRVYDPCCGSGVLLIEAALTALQQAPGLERRFALEGWADFQPELWDREADRARQRRRGDLTLPPLLGIEADPSIADQARANVETAGLSGVIRISTGLFSDHSLPEGPGLLVCNPPYGHRVGSEDDLEQLYRSLGSFVRDQASGWQLWLLSGNASLTGALRLKASRRIPVSNGGIDCRWLNYGIR